ncbi:leucine rich repeat (LRR) protein [Hallella colorans]|uniref:Leucine rich repeat (LRR) protein n=2 Tax=Hallella colorans TaxID=1703337 RepID=A0A2U0UIM1_9BACT|nr:leucine rich repeat (LRR) protein [Hallella colorans]
MKQIYLLKTKRRGIFLALLLLMALPMAAQTAGNKFKVDGLNYIVLDAAKLTLKVLPETNYKQYTDTEGDAYSAYNGTLSGILDLTKPVSYNGKNWKVTEIGKRAFQLENITEVKLPDGMTRIGYKAFYKTASLTTIKFPSSLTVIETSAFSASGLTGTVTFPDNTFIGANAFQSCVKITSLDITKVQYLGSGCFRNCSGLSKVTVPLSAKIGQKLAATLSDYKLTGSANETSGEYAFADCYNLTEATIESGIATVPNHMFAYCGELKTVTVPTSVKSIGGGAFRQCFSLSSIDMPEVNSIGKEAFWGCFNLKGDLVLSNKVKNLGDLAFGYTSLTGVKWEGAAGCTIGNNVFTGCHFLEYVDLQTLTNPTVANNRLNRHTGTAIDNLAGGLLSRTIVYLPQGVTFTFKDGEDVNFVKSDGTCTKLSVQDGADYEFPVGFTATTAVYNKWEVFLWDDEVLIGEFNNENTYTGVNYSCDEYDYDNNIAPLITYRDFSGIKAGKNCFTMLLPYAIKKRPSGIRAYKLNYKGTYTTPVQGGAGAEYKEYYLFTSIPDESELEANKPYLLRVVDGKEHSSKDFGAANVEIAASGSTKVNDDGTEVTQTPSTSALRNVNAGTLKPQGFSPMNDQGYNFVGGTERLNNQLAVSLHTWLLNTDWMNIDVWRQVKSGSRPVFPGSDLQQEPATAAPFRGYIQVINNAPGGAKRFVILREDETTGIDNLQQGKPLTGAQRIYTLDGRYVGTSFDTLPSGIYVIKGKKIAK